jgi:hypothetical protein
VGHPESFLCNDDNETAFKIFSTQDLERCKELDNLGLDESGDPNPESLRSSFTTLASELPRQKDEE